MPLGHKDQSVQQGRFKAAVSELCLKSRHGYCNLKETAINCNFHGYTYTIDLNAKTATYSIYKTRKRQSEIFLSIIGKTRSRSAVLRSGGLGIRLCNLCKPNVFDI